jgi:hypothetical protein
MHTGAYFLKYSITSDRIAYLEERYLLSLATYQKIIPCEAWFNMLVQHKNRTDSTPNFRKFHPGWHGTR